MDTTVNLFLVLPVTVEVLLRPVIILAYQDYRHHTLPVIHTT